MEPGESNLINIAITKYTGDNNINKILAQIISKYRFSQKSVPVIIGAEIVK